MKLRYLFFILLGVVLTLTIASCHREPARRVGISQCSLDDWREKFNDEIERELIFYPGTEVEILSADDDPVKQERDIRRFIEEGYDIIVMSPVEAQALTPVAREAIDKGIPVLTFDRMVEGDAYTAHIGADNLQIGHNAGEFVAERLGGRGKVLEIGGLAGSTPARDRHRGLHEVINRYPGMQLVATAYGTDWTPVTGERLADSLLALYPDVDALVVQNDRMAIAARQVANKRGLDRLIITGVDGVVSTGINAVADSVLDATIFYPTGGYEIMRTVDDILKGKQVERNLILSTGRWVDASNVDMMQLQEASLAEDTRKIARLKDKVDQFSTLHSTQRALIYSIVCILLLCAVSIFALLRGYWERQRSQEALARQNEQLEQQNEQLEQQKKELTEQKAELTEQRDQMAELNERLNTATTAKLAFFTNVSHDLRTPLTLIVEPLRQLREAPQLTESQRTLLGLASKNVKILMRLINQILDFRKYENGKLTLKLSEVNAGECFADWTGSFRTLASKRHIKLRLDDAWPVGQTMALDVEKVERIYFNIMSNAFKFTPDNGSITVNVNGDDHLLTVRIADTGRGMNADDMQRVFERFYQAETIRPEGSGIGLAVSKAFATMHGGDITVDSREGEGSVFTLTIPVTHIGAEESPVMTENVHISSDEVNIELGNPDETPEIELGDKPCVLVIDDNADIRAMLKQLLSPDYTVLEAPDGRYGIKMATRYLPDLVVCDVMMPGMDGMECCRRLKEETATSHIPVLLLTACALDEQRSEGYRQGADGYLSKPFSGNVLQARVESLITNRRRLSEALIERNPASVKPDSAPKPDPTKAKSGDLDSDFYRAFTKIVEDQLANSELTTEEVAEQMGFSRTQLYRKLKALTNYSPNELIRNMRLRKARHLLATTEDTVSQIAYAVGFNSPSYFSKCFRECYGELPADIQKRTSKV
ncbi:MAG: substrate-binding domain-containing protein [Muribaculaceae bacterium]|nr:substrate-binding domain-containing protein [Muribaculaceae bacterium]